MKTGFPPIARPDAAILILGSMPGEESLRKKQYYAHPRNSFWPIMEKLFSTGDTLGYDSRVLILLDNRIALWDVLYSCRRPGSLDSAIRDETIVTNDFETFFQQYREIRRIFFNGARAEQEFNRKVLPRLNMVASNFTRERLPSTSPAMASLTLEEKAASWEAVINTLI